MNRGLRVWISDFNTKDAKFITEKLISSSGIIPIKVNVSFVELGPVLG